MRNHRSRGADTIPPSLKHSFPNSQPYTNAGFVTPNVYDDVDIDNMTMQEYELYMANQCRREESLNSYNRGFTSNFRDYSQNTPDLQPDDRDVKIVDELFRIGVENLQRMEQEEIHNGCNNEEFEDVNHDCKDLLDFAISSNANIFSSVCELDIHNSDIDTTIKEEEVQKECDEGDMDDS